MARKYEIKKDSLSQTQSRKKESYIKHWQNETLVKSNINCEKYTKNINLYDKAEIFFKISKKNNNHTLWCRRCAVATNQAFFIFTKPAIQNPNI